MKEITLKEIRITKNISNKHKNTMNTLYVITYILLFPIVLLGYLADFLHWLYTKVGWYREDIVHMIFKFIYKREIISDMRKRGGLSERKY